ncbi:MAG: hypothetical protein ACUVQ8_01035 [Nitrososphaeria archaeon]
MSPSVSELRKAYSYGRINVRGHIFGSLILSLALSSTLTIMFPAEGLALKGFIFSTAFAVSFYFALTYPYLVYSQHRFMISSFGYMALSDLSVITAFSSLFDACYHIYLSRYPIISSMFRDVVISGLRGEDISTSIKKMAYSQPSSSFRDGLISFLFGRRGDGEGSVNIYGEAADIYKSLTSQIETKFSILMGLCFFCPVIAVIFSSLYVHDMFQIVALTSFQVILLSLLYMVLTRSLVKHRMV